jgi:hypothetical protein
MGVSQSDERFAPVGTTAEDKGNNLEVKLKKVGAKPWLGRTEIAYKSGWPKLPYVKWQDGGVREEGKAAPTRIKLSLYFVRIYFSPS